MTKTPIYEWETKDLASWLIARAEPAYRAGQISEWLYKKFVRDFTGMSNLPQKLIRELSNHFYIDAVTSEKKLISKDGTLKYVFRLHDGHFIESVSIPHASHRTFCISSQVGCALGCRFCATASMGIIRNLSVSEIVSQVINLQRDLTEEIRTNIVFMGMGEPLLNSENVMKSIHIMIDPEGIGWSPRRITLSTSGIVPELQRILAGNLNIRIALSLNASEDATRNRLMPINRKYPIGQLLNLLVNHSFFTAQNPLTIEYIMIKGLNDRDESAMRLGKMFAKQHVKINLITFNPHPMSRFKPSDNDRILTFQEILTKKGMNVRIRHSHGADIYAACGQLAGNQPEVSGDPFS